VSKSTRLTGPLKWHGGKYYLAKWILSLMPPHLHYVEAYAGGLQVLMAKDPFDPRHEWSKKWFSDSSEKGCSEVVNDLNKDLMNFWYVMQDVRAFKKFQRIAEAIPISQDQYEKANIVPTRELDVKAAVAFFVRCRQSRAGNFGSFSPLGRTGTARGMSVNSSHWLHSIDGLDDVHERLKTVVVLCDDALKIIKREDCKRTLFYLDPPYVHSTRVEKDVYCYEMTYEDHEKMLKVISKCSGSVMLSGYSNDLYDTKLKDWNRHDHKIAKASSGQYIKPVAVESLWCNF